MTWFIFSVIVWGAVRNIKMAVSHQDTASRVGAFIYIIVAAIAAYMVWGLIP